MTHRAVEFQGLSTDKATQNMVLRRFSGSGPDTSTPDYMQSTRESTELSQMPKLPTEAQNNQLYSNSGDLPSVDQGRPEPLSSNAKDADRDEDELSDWEDSDNEENFELSPWDDIREADNNTQKLSQPETNPFRRQRTQDGLIPSSNIDDQWWTLEDHNVKPVQQEHRLSSSPKLGHNLASSPIDSFRPDNFIKQSNTRNASLTTAAVETGPNTLASGLRSMNLIDLEPEESNVEAVASGSKSVPQHQVGNAEEQKPHNDGGVQTSSPTGVAGESVTDTATRRPPDNEVYQIKHIRWQDHRLKKGSPRESSILMQSANGPCPLLALVNALVLSTPSDVKTGLTEILESREQVSLGLLLDAVFEELMSGRRSNAVHELPDVSELYTFLVTLHTGMNVNPRFVPAKGSSSARGYEYLQTDLDLDAPRFGGFERTKEMALYGTFSIPLIHGWVPEPEDPAIDSLNRVAPTYEDAQNYLFLEDEFERKLQDGGLSTEDQLGFLDLTQVKGFLDKWPTQLSQYGLQLIGKGMKPGDFAILFRNDHFSTLYKEPKSNRLMALVTDAGYATHDEIVWESLVDIHGSSSEMYSGDFRSVNHVEQEEPAQIQPVTNTRPEPNTTGPAAANKAETSLSRSEQEDHDLALALQLQEEEEQRQRTQQQNTRDRRRSSQRQQSIVSSQGRPDIPPRQHNAPSVTPAPEERATTTMEQAEAAPPSYEQAAASPPYHPPGMPLNQQQTRALQAASESPYSNAIGRRRAGPHVHIGLADSQSVVSTGRRSNRADKPSGSEDRREGCIVM